MTVIHLNPCPFCGKPMGLFSSSAVRGFVFYHRRPGACAIPEFIMSWDKAKTLEEAADTWNRRGGDTTNVPV